MEAHPRLWGNQPAPGYSSSSGRNPGEVMCHAAREFWQGPGVVMASSSTPSLRALRSDDAEAVLAAFRSDPGMRRQGDISSMELAATYVGHLCHPEGPHRALAIVDGDRLVGLVAVTVDVRNRSGWFWYWMHREFRGRGWTSRAAATLANHALATGEVERLELAHRATNPASASVARAAGFIPEGMERQKLLVEGVRVDVLTYGRLRSASIPATRELHRQST